MKGRGGGMRIFRVARGAGRMAGWRQGRTGAAMKAAFWRAVAARDGAQAGRFVYGVRTTGIYCRPGCPSRRPLRGNVRFFDDARAARAAGFRPCRRCDPDGKTRRPG